MKAIKKLTVTVSLLLMAFAVNVAVAQENNQNKPIHYLSKHAAGRSSVALARNSLKDHFGNMTDIYVYNHSSLPIRVMIPGELDDAVASYSPFDNNWIDYIWEPYYAGSTHIVLTDEYRRVFFDQWVCRQSDIDVQLDPWGQFQAFYSCLAQ